MSTFKSIKDFNFDGKNINDNEVFRNIIEENFDYGKRLTEILRKNLDFEFSYIGEIFLNIPENLSENEIKKLEKYFTVRGNKVGSRGVGYYGLFGDAYKIENRGIYKKEFWESFWKEYDEYINILNSLKENKELVLLYLDNYRNFILLWIYILIIIRKSHSSQKIRPIQNMAFRSIYTDKLDNLIENLSRIYEIVIDNIISLSLEKSVDNIFMLPNIKDLYNNIKQILKDPSLIATKKGKMSLENYFKINNNLNIWFEKLFRNIREEDNIGILLSFFLQKNMNLNSIEDKKSIYELIMNFKKTKKKEYVIGNMYGGIEFSLLAKYLGYETGLINFSVYHLGNKNTYKYINDIFYPLNGENLKDKKVIIVDDNVYSGHTLEKIRTIFENNHIGIKHLASPRLYIPKNNKNISELKKHIALNSLYILPRIDKKNRNLNILIENKVKKFKKYKGKEFRSL